MNEEVNVEAKTVQIHACAFKEKEKKKRITTFLAFFNFLKIKVTYDRQNVSSTYVRRFAVIT